MIVLTDGVEREIVSFIGQQAPEQGGALLGPASTNLVSRFIPDPNAETTAVSYTPSKWLVDEVRRCEKDLRLQFKGIVHSHPGDFDKLSAGDLRTIADFFAVNPNLSRFYCPIVNRGIRTVQQAAHVLDLGQGIALTSYEARRPNKTAGFGRASQKQAQVDVRPVRATVMPVDAVVEMVARGLDETWACEEFESGHICLSGLHYEVRVMTCAEAELQLLFPPGFPATKPTALLTRKTAAMIGDTEELQFSWRLCGAGVSELSHHIVPQILERTAKERTGANVSETRSQQAEGCRHGEREQRSQPAGGFEQAGLCG